MLSSDAGQLSGNVTEVNQFHPLNAPSPMLVSPSGRATEVSLCTLRMHHLRCWGTLKRHRGESATIECFIPMLVNPSGKCHRGELLCKHRVSSDAGQPFWKRHQVSRTLECIISDAGQPVWKSHRGEPCALSECTHLMLVNPSGKVTEGACAPFECVLDAGQPFWKSHRGEPCATFECTLSDAGQPFWKSH